MFSMLSMRLLFRLERILRLFPLMNSLQILPAGESYCTALIAPLTGKGISLIALLLSYLNLGVRKGGLRQGLERGLRRLQGMKRLQSFCRMIRSEERRVGKEGRSRWSPH